MAEARLIDEAILEMPSQRRLVQLYDVGDRLKYPLIALESYSEDGQAVQHVSVADHSLIKIDPQESSLAFKARMASIGWTIRKEMNTPGHHLVAKAGNSIASIESWAPMAVELGTSNTRQRKRLHCLSSSDNTCRQLLAFIMGPA